MCSPGPLGQRICVGVSPCSPPAVKKKTVQNCNVLYLGFTSGRCNTRSEGLFALLGRPWSLPLPSYEKGQHQMLPTSQCAFTKRVGEDPSPSPQSDSEHSPRLVLIPHTMITSLCFCSTLSTHPHTTLIPRANKPRVRQLWRGARRRQGGRCRVAL